jgi:hypothetical protein
VFDVFLGRGVAAEKVGDVGVSLEAEESGGGGFLRGKSKRLGSTLVCRGDLVGFDGDLAENDFGQVGLLGDWRVVGVGEGEEIVPGDGVFEGGLVG